MARAPVRAIVPLRAPGTRMRVQAEVVVFRGDIAESHHRVECVAADPTGALRAASAHPERVTSFRSAAKPFQLLPFVERGHADALGASERELAIMAASHSGSRAHLALVRGLLDRLGLEPSALACGYHDPQDAESHARAEGSRTSGSTRRGVDR